MNTEILMNIWLALNIVFGLWSARNWLIYFAGVVSGRGCSQNQLGAILDLIIPASCLAYYFSI